MTAARAALGAQDPPAVPGAYALIIRLVGRNGNLPPGRYLYAGSAYGSGGIRARVPRHLRPDKSRHWHVDRLTSVGRVTAVVSVPGGHECAIVAAILRLPGVSVPAPRFGSSDCRTCAAHLLRLPDGLELGTIARAVQPLP